jgi:hypothetical protein
MRRAFPVDRDGLTARRCLASRGVKARRPRSEGWAETRGASAGRGRLLIGSRGCVDRLLRDRPRAIGGLCVCAPGGCDATVKLPGEWHAIDRRGGLCPAWDWRRAEMKVKLDADVTWRSPHCLIACATTADVAPHPGRALTRSVRAWFELSRGHARRPPHAGHTAARGVHRRHREGRARGASGGMSASYGAAR